VVDAEQTIQMPSEQNVHQTTLVQLKSLLMDARSDSSKQDIENKIQALEYKLNIQATAMTTPKKSLEDICKSLIEEEGITNSKIKVDREVGILEVREDFLITEGYHINSMWRGEYSGYEIEIYAGSLFQDEQKGLVILNIPELSLFKVFYTPQPNGSLRITQVDGYRLHLSAANGITEYFDIPAQQFTNDLAKSLSIADFPPAPTPIMDPCAQFKTP